MARHTKKSKKTKEQPEMCPVCMLRVVNVRKSSFSVKQMSAHINFVIDAYRNGEEYALFYLEKRELSFVQNEYSKDSLQEEGS